MKVLSIRQPYAALLVLGPKRFEARTWKTEYRGPVLIHASSAAVSSTMIDELQSNEETLDAVRSIGWTTESALKDLPRSAIIGQVDLADVIPSEDCEDASSLDKDLAAFPDPDTYFWRVANRLLIEPIPINGKLNLWTLPTDLEGEVTQALADARSQPPVWVTSPSNTGRPLRLIRFQAIDGLERIIGTKPMTMREIVHSMAAYTRERGLFSPAQVRLDDSLQFLAPGRKILKKDDYFSALFDHIERIEE